MDVLSFLVLGAGELWLDLECVSTKVISLGLEQVGWEILGTVTIEPAQGSGESGCWDTEKSSLGDNISPTRLSLVDGLVEEVAEEQVLEVVVCTVGGGDILQED